MTSRVFLDLPAEIRNNIYRYVLCYDGIMPELMPPRSSWQTRTVRTGSCRAPFNTRQDSYSNTVTDQSSMRMQLDVLTPVRKGYYPGVLPPVPAGDVLNLLRACRQIYEEAHAIFWAENAFVFASSELMRIFLHRIGAKALGLIRTLGIEKTVNTEWINLVHGDIYIGCWFPDFRIPPFLLPRHACGWEISFEEYLCLRDHWVADCSDASELRIRKFMIQCKTTYKWLTWPSTDEMAPTKDTLGATGHVVHNLCAGKFPPHKILLDSF